MPGTRWSLAIFLGFKSTRMSIFTEGNCFVPAASVGIATAALRVVARLPLHYQIHVSPHFMGGALHGRLPARRWFQ
jgi:hypothetical protein